MRAVMRPLAFLLPALLLTAAPLGPRPAAAQAVTDGSDAAVGLENARAALALVGRGMKNPDAVRYSGLRQGRAGALCGEADPVNRMGAHTGPRPFVADTAAGFAGIVPDAPELRYPASMAQYQAMQRTLDLYRANCSAE